MQGVGTNRYAYAGNDPVNKSDPNGHFVVPAIGFIAAVLGALFGGTTPANAPGHNDTPESISDGRQIANMAMGAAAGAKIGNVVKESIEAYGKKKDKERDAKAASAAEQAADPDKPVANSKPNAGVNTQGKLYSKTVTVDGNTYVVEGEMSINGSNVTLNNLNVTKIGGDPSISSGAFNSAKTEIAKEFKSMGFESATINADRISGANPGRSISIDIDLTRYP